MSTPNPSASSPGDSGRRRRRSPYLSMVVIFVCGMVAGLGLGVIGLHVFMSYQFKHPNRMYTQLVDKLSVGLDLTPEQKQKVDEITRQKKAEFENLITHEFRTLGNAHFDSLRDAVAGALDPERAKLWRDQFEQFRAKSLPPFPPPSNDTPGPPGAAH